LKQEKKEEGGNSESENTMCQVLCQMIALYYLI